MEAVSQRNALLGAMAILAVLLYITGLAAISVAVLLSLITSILIGRAGFKVLGIEFVTLASVIAGTTYGPLAGGATALALMSFHIAVGRYIGPYILWVIPEYILIGVLAGIIEADFVFLGTALSAGAHGIGLVFTALFNRQYLGHFLPYAVTNVAFNYIIFSAASLIL